MAARKTGRPRGRPPGAKNKAKAEPKTETLPDGRVVVTRTEFARRLGISRQAVVKRTVPQGGPIPVYGPNLMVDPDEAEALWFATMHNKGSEQRSTARLPSGDAGGLAPPAAGAIGAADDDDTDDADDADDAAEIPAFSTAPAEQGSASNAARAKLAISVIKAQKDKIDLERIKGNLIDKSAALRQAFLFSRKMRDGWMNWPARVAPIIAAELGVGEAAVYEVLDRHVRENLNDLADQTVDL